MHTLKIYALEAKYEFLKNLRLPIYSISTVVFPVMFYLIFGIGLNGDNNSGPVNAATYLLATYGAFGVIGAALFGFGVGVSAERGQGWMRLKRASPMPPLAYFVAKIFMATLFSAIIVLALTAIGIFSGKVTIAFTTWLALFGILLLGTLPFSAIGLFFGYILGPNSAPATLNLIYIPMAFASGLWIPVQMLPNIVQNIAPFLPPYHYSQLALSTIGASVGSNPWVHVIALLGFTVAFLALAVWAYKRDEGKTYG